MELIKCKVLICLLSSYQTETSSILKHPNRKNKEEKLWVPNVFWLLFPLFFSILIRQLINSLDRWNKIEALEAFQGKLFD